MKVRIFLLLFVLFSCVTSVSQAQVPIEISAEKVQLKDGTYYIHTVMRKQTLYSIAKAYGVDQQTIIDKNPTLLKNDLRAFQMLLIPTPQTYKLMREAKTANSDQPRFLPTPAAATKPSSSHDVLPPKTTITFSQDEPKHDTIPSVPVVEQQTEQPVKQLVDDDIAVVSSPKEGESMKVILMLPFSDFKNDMNNNSADFFEGVLLAVEKLQQQGMSIDLSLFSTSGSVENTSELINNGVLQGAHLIIGPVYSEPFKLAAQWAEKNQVPIVSPLAIVDNMQNRYVVQFSPVSTAKYDKLVGNVASSTANVVLLEHTQSLDTAAYNDMVKILPVSTQRMAYSRANQSGDIAVKMDREKTNIIFAPIYDQKGSVEDLLSKIAAINSPVKRFDIQVVGTTRWRSLPNVNPELLFKTNVIYPSSYYYDNSCDTMAMFYNSYIQSFGRLPSLFAMRGYDVMILMSEALQNYGPALLTDIKMKVFQPLQMPYRFVGDGTLDNDQWVLVTHTSDHRVELK